MSIILDQLSKSFGGQAVVSSLCLEVSEGELFVLLGPSGSGKSTVLRLIAGLLEADGGKVLLHGRDVTHVRPQDRGVGLVFQDYALFRHLTVAQNIEFSLKIRRVKPQERRRRCEELLELVDLVGLGRRYPHQLSGGQQQRVALARALAHRPEVLLLDEPLGALDAKIRTDLRRSLRRIQSELGVTTIFVTHDQEEGFELADRIGVMSFGRLLEVGPPDELYLHPQTEFVATFLGKANLMVGQCLADGIRIGPLCFPHDPVITGSGSDRRVQVLFRPEDVSVKDSAEALNLPLLGKAVVEEVGFSGSLEKLRLRLPHPAGARAIAPPVPFGADYMLVESVRSQHQARRYPLQPGDPAWVGVRRVHALLHPGLGLLLLLDGSSPNGSVLELGSRIGRLAHARLTLLGLGGDDGEMRRRLREARERIGSGPAAIEERIASGEPGDAVAREAGCRPYDLVLQRSSGQRSLMLSERILEAGEHHLLRVPDSCAIPRTALVCVAVGEPGKEDIFFAGRLLRHLGTKLTLLTVVPRRCPDDSMAQARRFLEAGIRTLAQLDVEADTVLRHGRSHEEIRVEIAQGGYDLVVLGAPLTSRSGDSVIGGLTRDLLSELVDLPVLVVRSRLQRSDDRSLALVDTAA